MFGCFTSSVQTSCHQLQTFLRSFSTVLFHVSLYVAGNCAGVIALFASEKFLTSVGVHVLLQVTGLCTFVAALIATVMLFSTVGEHVSL